MTIREISNLVEGSIVCGAENEDRIIEAAFSSDLRSDVRTVMKDNLLLITGLAGVQTIRTAIMSDIICILLVRDKKAPEEMVTLARENRITIIEWSYSMYRAGGILFKAGIEPVY